MDVQQFEMAGLGKYMASQQSDEMADALLGQLDSQVGPAAGQRPLWMLEYVQAAIEELEKQRDYWATTARAHGASFTEIGEALGVSKQAAAKKYGKTD
jgi:hypothetical protein